MLLTEQIRILDNKANAIEQQEKDYQNGVSGVKKPLMTSEALRNFATAARNIHGDYEHGEISVKETLTTTDSIKMIPKLIEGELREASEPEYLGTKFLQTINMPGNDSTAVYIIPVVGEVVAGEVTEGGRYPQENPDFNTIENSYLEVRVKKIGIKITVTEEAISDTSWDILGLNVRKMSRAMARYKEELIFNNFTTHGHCVLDNISPIAEEGMRTTGLDENGKPNDTLSVEDLIDMVMALMANGYNASDIIMHPLVWLVFAKNSMIGNGLTFGALGASGVSPWGTIQGTPGPFGLQNNGEGQKFILEPSQVQNRLPVPIRINFSPYVAFDKINKRFDMYCIDSREVGILVQKEKLSTQEWKENERDLLNLKCKERYGVGILNHGKSISVARGIAADVSYPKPPVVTIHNIPEIQQP